MLQSFFLQVDVTEIVVHKTNQPDTVIDLFDTHGLTRESGAEINFLFVDADSSAAGDHDGPIVERIREFSELGQKIFKTEWDRIKNDIEKP